MVELFLRLDLGSIEAGSVLVIAFMLPLAAVFVPLLVLAPPPRVPFVGVASE